MKEVIEEQMVRARPFPKSINSTLTMRANRAKNTGPELSLRKSLREAGVTGYRLHWSKAPGKPDIAFPGKKIAVFVNGCFWHRCSRCNLPIPIHNRKYWIQKLQRNVKKDKKYLSQLMKLGWKSVVTWECMIKEDIESCRDIVLEVLEGNDRD